MLQPAIRDIVGPGAESRYLIRFISAKIGGEVGVDQRHLDVAVAEDLLQREDVPPDMISGWRRCDAARGKGEERPTTRLNRSSAGPVSKSPPMRGLPVTGKTSPSAVQGHSRAATRPRSEPGRRAVAGGGPSALGVLR